MGGNALKEVKTRRYQRDEYHALEKEVLAKLRLHFSQKTVIAPIKAYSTKESFGDMDILVSSDMLPNDWHVAVSDLLESKEVFKNGSVVSFEHREFQIDLITIPLSDIECAMRYFDYNDLGNLLGRIAHMMGLKLGHDGLSYNWRVDTYQFKNVVVAKNWHDVLPVLGLDPGPYFKGFDTLEDIFKYVASSKFFDPAIYLLHNRNNVSRVRDMKRKTYMEFLDWCETLPPYPPQRKEDKRGWLPYLFEAIPGFEQIYNEVQADWDKEVEFRKRFNGDVVKAATKLEGRTLGEFMKWFKERHAPELRKKVLVLNPSVISGWIEYNYEVFQKELLAYEACNHTT